MRQRGFTLIEVMIVVAIVGILASLSIGMGSSWKRRGDLTSTARAVYSAMMVGRSEAMKQQKRVYVRFNSGTSVQAFIDNNADKDYDAGTDVLVYSFPSPGETFPNGVTFPTFVNVATNVGTPPLPTVSFDSRGYSLNASTGAMVSPEITVRNTQITPSDRVVASTVAGAIRVR